MWTDDPVFWHTAIIRYGNFRSYNFFNVDLTDINGDRYECNEFDFILDYTFLCKFFCFAPGVLHFTSPTNFFKPTTKITLQVKTVLFLHPGVRIRVDPEKSRGSYFILDIYQRFELPRCKASIDFYGSLSASLFTLSKRTIATLTWFRANRVTTKSRTIMIKEFVD